MNAQTAIGTCSCNSRIEVESDSHSAIRDVLDMWQRYHAGHAAVEVRWVEKVGSTRA